MAHQPTPAEIRSFAIRHDVTEEQAQRMLTDHGPNEDGWDETARSLLHFLKAPS